MSDAERLLKNVAIARSGIYLYTRDELPGLGINSIPDKYRNDRVFSVYRPASVLAANADKYARQPLTNKHPNEMLNPDNNSTYIKGWVGDEVTIENSNDEIIIRSSVNLVDRDVIKAYDSGIREVSPGYVGTFSWKDGSTSRGQQYQIVMDDITSVNHLALVPEGRGGPSVRILDSGENVKTLQSGLFRWIKNLFVSDKASKTFREIMTDTVNARQSFTEDDFDNVRNTLFPAVEDIPESQDKLALKRMIFDMWSMKNLSSDGAKKYAEVVSDLYEKLDEQSNKSVTDSMEEKMPDKDGEVKDEEKKIDGDPERKEVSVADDDKDVERSGKRDEDDKKDLKNQEDNNKITDGTDVADLIKTQADLGPQGKDGDNEFNDNDIGTIGGLGKRMQQLERSMTQIALQMETYGTKHVEGVPAHSSATEVTNGRDPNIAPNVSPPTQISDSAPKSPFTATMDSKITVSKKGIDLEKFDAKYTNGGKK